MQDYWQGGENNGEDSSYNDSKEEFRYGKRESGGLREVIWVKELFLMGYDYLVRFRKWLGSYFCGPRFLGDENKVKIWRNNKLRLNFLFVVSGNLL